MKKIVLLMICLIGSVFFYAQDSLSTDSTMTDTLNTNASKKINTALIANATKADADSAYAHNDFASAIQLYKSLLKEKGESADIYYNLGNSYFKVDNLAEAILSYERALLLSPGDSDIRFNLEMARSKTVDKVNPVSEMFFITWYKSLVNCMGADAWAKWGIGSFILLLVALISYIFGKHLIIKKTGFICSIIFFLLFVFSNLFAAEQKDELINRKSAIIIAPSVTVKSTPNESGTDLFILHEGRKVGVTDNSMKEWKEIKLEDGNVGWVPNNAIEII